MNYYVAIWCLLAVTASIKADGGLGLGGLVYAPGHASADYYAYPRYAFEYAVKDPHTGDNKAQWEKRDGDVVKGAYSLVEPDGSLRIVEYWADDKSGFNAVVKRVGPNLHPATVPVTPIYKAPIPLLGSAAISAPISIGPIAKYSGLASAPLLTGPLGLGGAAVSTASLIKAAPIAVTAPIAPLLPAPIIKSAPILGPIGLSSPFISAPIKSAPYLSGAQWGPLPGPIIAAPAPLLKAPLGIPAVSLGDGLLKGGYSNYGLGLGKGGYDNIALGLAKGGYDNVGLGLAKIGYENLGLGLAKGGYDNLGLGLLKGGYDNYGLGYAKAGPVLPALGGPWGGAIGGWKH